MYTFDPKLHTTIFAGIELTGWAEGDMISFSFDNDAFTDMVGVDGDVTRARSHDERGTAEASLAESSPVNDQLSELHAADRSGVNGEGVGAFRMIDTGTGRTKLEAAQAWVMKAPDIEIAATPGTRVWRIRLAKAKLHVGGRTPTSGAQV